MDMIGKYKIEKIISDKKYMKIYVCSLKGEDKLYKVRSISKDMPNLDEFITEAQQINNIKIDKIPRFFEKIEDEENIYFVYEFIKGVSLEKYLDINGYISEQRALGMLREMVDILQKVYNETNKKMVHRGIKADNIIIDLEGNLNIIDFHLNRIYDSNADKKEADISPDLLGMGVTMLYALTGYNILLRSDKKEPFKLCDKGISKDFERILKDLIDRNYNSYDELMKDLNQKEKEKECIIGKVAILAGVIIIIAIVISLLS